MSNSINPMPIDALLNELSFVDTHYVEGRASVADLFTQNKRCGIYVLHCSNGEYYAGQAVDVVRRYNQHRITHTDISHVSFKQVARDNLNDEEHHVIKTLERRGVRLRNISLISVPLRDSDFDLLMPEEEQNRWLNDLSFVDISGERYDDPDQRRRLHRKFAVLSEMPEYLDVRKCLKEYARIALPRAKQGEVSFWSCTCLPPPANPRLFARMNINVQEVLTVWRERSSVGFSFHTSKSVLERVHGAGLASFFAKHRFAYDGDYIYKSGGTDQINIVTYSVKGALCLMSDPVFAKSIRLFNLRLMKKGPSLNKSSHCFDLADIMLEVLDDR